MTLTYSLIGLAAALAGCSDNGFSSGGNGGGTVTPTGTPTPGASCSPTSSTALLPGVTGGSTVVLNASQSELDSYLGWTTYAPTNIAININLQQTGQFANNNYGYGGVITIGFADSPNGQTTDYEDSFSSAWQGEPNTVSSQAQNDQYNLGSLQYPGYPNGAFHGFYQGTTYCNGEPMPPGNICTGINGSGGQIFGGAVIVVLNNVNGAADSCGNTTASGSVWYKNFVGTGPIDGPTPFTSCWFLSAGPYQCREWLWNSGVNTLEALLPNGTGGYQELGTFSGVDMNQAFNGTWQVLK